ncbi:gamma-glutamylcyclotransferase family protein [Nocardia sp. CNY236]|uniref:gamma-glutamylcyclotransferase family protein n=1 Tax=Nocardia sp. CNY236 TaxID=1169152 RepID=UPI0009DDF116|nr:gamma-glutamylcyclotransferase family protein [Nocardia sp. CNY236]
MPLFAYGTLQILEVVRTLIGRVPHTRPGELDDWICAPLPFRPYPGLVPRPGIRTVGLTFTDLTPTEWMRLDRFEDPDYSLELVTLNDGTEAWVYAWQLEVSPGTWNCREFIVRHLAEYLERCRDWLSRDGD